MRRFIALSLVVALAALACGDTADTTLTVPPGTVAPTITVTTLLPDPPTTVTAPPDTQPPTTTTTTPAPAPFGCAAFEDLALGTTYVLGDSFTTNGVTVTVGEFFTGGSPFDNFTEVDNSGMAGGSGNEMWVNNVTLNFQLPPSPAGWSVQFGEYGGEVNLAVNGDNAGADTADFQDWNGSVFGGVEVQASGGLGTADGQMLLIGPGVSVLTIGGQELWIDNVCPLGEVPEPPTAGCVTFDDLALGTLYVLGDMFVSDGVTVTVGEFFTGGSPFDNFTEVDNSGLAGGSANEMEINNVTLNFELPASPGGWSVQFGEYGGEVNLAVNGDNAGADTADFQDWNGSVFGGVEVQASGGLGTADGKLLLIGPGVSVLTIGGQELWIDNLCPLS